MPADLVLVCGVFGNVTDDDVMRTIDLLPTLCAPGATVIWTRHRRAPDLTPAVRRRFAAAGFEEVAFHALDGTTQGVGMHRLTAAPCPFAPDERLFTFVGYGVLGETCKQCGFQYAIGRADITPLAAIGRTGVRRTVPALRRWRGTHAPCPRGVVTAGVRVPRA